MLVGETKHKQLKGKRTLLVTKTGILSHLHFATLLYRADTCICVNLRNSGNKRFFTGSEKLARSNHLIPLFTLRKERHRARANPFLLLHYWASQHRLISVSIKPGFCFVLSWPCPCLWAGLCFLSRLQAALSLTLNSTPLQRGSAFPSFQHVLTIYSFCIYFPLLQWQPFFLLHLLVLVLSQPSLDCNCHRRRTNL